MKVFIEEVERVGGVNHWDNTLDNSSYSTAENVMCKKRRSKNEEYFFTHDEFNN